jgi:hypothetical protein
MDGDIPDCNFPLAIAYDDGHILVDDAGGWISFRVAVFTFTDGLADRNVLWPLDRNAHQLVANQEGSERALRLIYIVAAFGRPYLRCIHISHPQIILQTV